jgi:hypothetical protein
MATFNTIIDDARYDLRDYQTGLEFDDAELLNFINRMIRLLESTLTSLNSDLVQGTATLSFLIATNSLDIATALNSGKWDSIRSLWNSTDKLQKISVDELFNIRQSTSTQTGAPNFWALGGTTLQFDKTSGVAYSLTCYYNSKTGTVTASSTTPYNGIFDDSIREMLVMHAKAKKEGILAKAEIMYGEMFRKRAMEIEIRRSFLPKTYSIDF